MELDPEVKNFIKERLRKTHQLNLGVVKIIEVLAEMVVAQPLPPPYDQISKQVSRQTLKEIYREIFDEFLAEFGRR